MALIDRDALAAPIPGDCPSGEWLRREGTYAAVQEAMREERGDPAYGIEEKTADWLEVEELCKQAATRTRDFYLAVSYLQALGANRGAAGLADGFWYLATLHESFWDSFHPQPRDEGENITGRVNQLEAMLRSFPRILGGVPMGEGDPVLSWYDWSHAGEKLPGGEQSPFTRDDRTSLSQASSWEFYDTAARGAEAAVAELNRLDNLIDTTYGNQAPSLSNLKSQLADLASALAKLLDEKGPGPHQLQAQEVLNQSGATFLDLDWLAGHFREGLALSRGLNSANAAVADNAAGMVPDEGWMVHLDGLWRAGDGYEQRSEGAPEPLPGAAPGAGGQTIVVAAPTISGDAVGALTGACRALRQQDPENSVSFTTLRALCWRPLAIAEPDEQPLPGPTPGLREKLQSLFEAENWPLLIEECEVALESADNVGWLDLHRFACAAMGQIGFPYGKPRKECVEALKSILRRYRWLPEHVLADGKPAADDITKGWIEAEVSPDGGGGGGGGGSSAPAASNGVLAKALDVLENEDMQAAIQFVQTSSASASSNRDRAVLDQDLSEVCIRAEHPEYAIPILERLRQDVVDKRVNEWESTDFFARTLELLYRAYAAREQTEYSEELTTAKLRVADELGRIDLNRRLALEAS